MENIKKQVNSNGKLNTKFYEKELIRLQIELVRLQEWIKNEGLKVVVV